MSRNVLITGATGKQGGAVVDALLAASAPFHILALTRNPGSAAAKALAARAVELVTGNLDNPDPIFTRPIWGVFSVQLSVAPKVTPQREIAQGIGLIDAAVRANVKHFVYSSGDIGDPPTPGQVAALQSKVEIEQHLFASPLSWTVLRPVIFFENFTPDIVGRIFAGALKHYVDPNRKLQYISTADIGWFGAQALLHPDHYQRRTIRLASDELNFAELAKVFKDTTGQEFPLPWGGWLLPWLVFHVLLKDLGVMYKHFSDHGFDVDIEEVRRLHPDLINFQQWLLRSSFLKTPT